MQMLKNKSGVLSATRSGLKSKSGTSQNLEARKSGNRRTGNKSKSGIQTGDGGRGSKSGKKSEFHLGKLNF